MVANYPWLTQCVPSQPCANYVMTKNSGLSYSTIFTPSPNGPGCRPSKRGNRHLGFTVIELIVCMGIVAVLCGILLPSLRATREASMKLRCASNMHQIGVAMTAYGIQSDGRIPPSNNVIGAIPPRHELMAARLQIGGAAGPTGWDGLGILVKGGYLGDCQCLYCPSHHGEHSFERYAADYANKDTVSVQIYTNYHYSGHIQRQIVNGLQGVRETPITLDSGSSVLLLTDGLRTRMDFNHITGLNRMFADLSMEWWADTSNQLRNQIPEGATFASAPSANFQTIWDQISGPQLAEP